MGISVFGDGFTAPSRTPITHRFYTPMSWVDGAAEAQLNEVSKLAGVTHIAAFPDLHPGKYGPVGCAILADEIYPELIGNDIGCGMALFALDLPARKLKLEKAAAHLRKLGEVDAGDFGLGTIGGGNHFCEVLKIDKSDYEGATLFLLVHSGSRGLGTEVFASALSDLRNRTLKPDDAARYKARHDEALEFAARNRMLIANHAASLLKAKAKLIADVPHNLVELTPDGWLHRKGAARADALVPLAGSRSSHSYLMRPLGQKDSLASLAHGAGRRFNRSQMQARIKSRSSLKAQERNRFGGHVICDDRAALAEEASEAYKSISAVVNDLAEFQIAEPVAKFTPLITYKNAKFGDKK